MQLDDGLCYQMSGIHAFPAGGTVVVPTYLYWNCAQCNAYTHFIQLTDCATGSLSTVWLAVAAWLISPQSVFRDAGGGCYTATASNPRASTIPGGGTALNLVGIYTTCAACAGGGGGTSAGGAVPCVSGVAVTFGTSTTPLTGDELGYTSEDGEIALEAIPGGFHYVDSANGISGLSGVNVAMDVNGCPILPATFNVFNGAIMVGSVTVS